MRTNAQLNKEWQNKIMDSETYTVEIYIMSDDTGITLNVGLNVDGETIDSECIMYIENAEEPTAEMLKKFKAEATYFKKHFKNINEIKKVIIV